MSLVGTKPTSSAVRVEPLSALNRIGDAARVDGKAQQFAQLMALANIQEKLDIGLRLDLLVQRIRLGLSLRKFMCSERVFRPLTHNGPRSDP